MKPTEALTRRIKTVMLMSVSIRINLLKHQEVDFIQYIRLIESGTKVTGSHTDQSFCRTVNVSAEQYTLPKDVFDSTYALAGNVISGISGTII